MPCDLIYIPCDLIYMPADVIYMPVDVIYMPADVIYMPADVIYMPADVIYTPWKGVPFFSKILLALEQQKFKLQLKTPLYCNGVRRIRTFAN